MVKLDSQVSMPSNIEREMNLRKSHSVEEVPNDLRNLYLR